MRKTLLDRALERHNIALTRCRACGSRVAGAVPVISLASNPRVMLVGQAPGQVEKTDQRPFAGRAGKTLFKWLALAGVSEDDARRRIYISAITRCYPGPSPTGRGDRVPSREEQSLCGRWHDAEFSLIQPRVIVPVGRLAINRFLGTAPLERMIGREHAYELNGHTSIIIPLPHPSGASGWLHGAGHAELLASAIDILRQRLGETLYL